MFPIKEDIPVHRVNDPAIEDAGINLFIKREDLLHPHISGNKWRKLKYNIREAKKRKKNTLLTFGGAYSNHIAATAAAGKEFNFNTIGVIRGEEHLALNSTLQFAVDCGMQLYYADRVRYKHKSEDSFIKELENLFGTFYLIPEGGANDLGVKGCMEILVEPVIDFDYVCCACGTGSTLAGLVLSLKQHQKALGFSSLKGGGFLKEEVNKMMNSFSKFIPVLPSLPTSNEDNFKWDINTDYHFEGYAKINKDLVDFVKNFEISNGILLDYVYTGKMMFGIYDLIQKGYFKKGQSILAIHTGGLQGNKGMQN